MPVDQQKMKGGRFCLSWDSGWPTQMPLDRGSISAARRQLRRVCQHGRADDHDRAIEQHRVSCRCSFRPATAHADEVLVAEHVLDHLSEHVPGSCRRAPSTIAWMSPTMAGQPAYGSWTARSA